MTCAGTRPDEIGRLKGKSGKTVRAWLRTRWPEQSPGQGGEWFLNHGQVAETLLHFTDLSRAESPVVPGPGPRRGVATRSVPFGRAWLVEEGFVGFESFKALLPNKDGGDGRLAAVPKTRGVYVVLREQDDEPTFLELSVGGWFKDRNPTVEPDVLRQRWIEGSHCVYVGRAGDLQRRLTEFARFGIGKKIGHWGGRYIWQLEGSPGFVVAWKETLGVDPADAERDLLARFRKTHGGKPPLANIA